MKIYEGRIVYQEIQSGNAERLDTSKRVSQYLKDVFNEHPLQEQLIVIPMNRKNYPLGRFTVSIGTATSALVHPREVFRPAILAGATAIIVAHNHPSGDPAPSRGDIQVTRQLREAAKVLSIDLLDHIIAGREEDDPQGLGYYSFNEAGLV